MRPSGSHASESSFGWVGSAIGVLSPAGHSPIGPDPTRMEPPRGDSAELAPRSGRLTVPVRTPTRDCPVATDPTRMPTSGRHSSELSPESVSLTIGVPAPANNRPIASDPTRMPSPGRHSSELSLGSICLTIPVRPPANNRPIASDPTRMPIPGRHHAELSLGSISLTVHRFAPQQTTVQSVSSPQECPASGRHHAEFPLRGFGLTPRVRPPANNRPISKQPTREPITTRDCCELPTLRSILRWLLWPGRIRLESTAQKRCHLSPSRISTRTVPEGLRRTPRRHTHSRQSINTRRVNTPLNIHKPTRRTLTKTETTHQERRHLGPSNSIRRTEPQRPGSATRSDTQLGETFHMRRPPLARVHIRERRRLPCHRIIAVDQPNQPHRHHPPPDRVNGAEHPRSALRPRQHTPSRQSLHRTPMRPSLINIRKPRTRISRPSRYRNPHPKNHPNNSDHNHQRHPPTSNHTISPHRHQLNSTQSQTALLSCPGVSVLVVYGPTVP